MVFWGTTRWYKDERRGGKNQLCMEKMKRYLKWKLLLQHAKKSKKIECWVMCKNITCPSMTYFEWIIYFGGWKVAIKNNEISNENQFILLMFEWIVMVSYFNLLWFSILFKHYSILHGARMPSWLTNVWSHVNISQKEEKAICFCLQLVSLLHDYTLTRSLKFSHHFSCENNRKFLE